MIMAIQIYKGRRLNVLIESEERMSNKGGRRKSEKARR